MRPLVRSCSFGAALAEALGMDRPTSAEKSKVVRRTVVAVEPPVAVLEADALAAALDAAPVGGDRALVLCHSFLCFLVAYFSN